MSAHVAAPSAPMTFREVLRPTVIRRVRYATMSVVFFAQLPGLVLSGVLAQALGVRAVFFLCAVFAWALTCAGKLLLSTERHAAAI